MNKISVILPIYNESTCIDTTFDSVLEYSKLHSDYHFIFVNDGSNDNTLTILESKIAATKSNQITLISYKQNQGKGYAIKKGIESSYGEYICFIDSDLAYSLNHLEFLVDKLELFDIVIGCRNLIPENLKRVKTLRFFAGKIFNMMSRGILSLSFTDMQAGLKGFKKDVAKTLFEKQTIKRFCFDVELLYLAKKMGYSIDEIPVIVSSNHIDKDSKVNLLVDSIIMLKSLIQIRINDSLSVYEKIYFVKF